MALLIFGEIGWRDLLSAAAFAVAGFFSDAKAGVSAIAVASASRVSKIIEDNENTGIFDKVAVIALVDAACGSDFEVAVEGAAVAEIEIELGELDIFLGVYADLVGGVGEVGEPIVGLFVCGCGADGVLEVVAAIGADLEGREAFVGIRIKGSVGSDLLVDDPLDGGGATAALDGGLDFVGFFAEIGRSGECGLVADDGSSGGIGGDQDLEDQQGALVGGEGDTAEDDGAGVGVEGVGSGALGAVVAVSGVWGDGVTDFDVGKLGLSAVSDGDAVFEDIARVGVAAVEVDDFFDADK